MKTIKKIFIFKKGEIIDGTEEIHEVINNMIISDKLNTDICPEDIKITLTKNYLNDKNLERGYQNG